MNKKNWPKIDSDHLIVYSEQMVEVEKECFSYGMPEESLMEKAGLSLSNWFLERKVLLQNGVIIFIGPGHNGGDGAIIARELFLKGFVVKIYCPFPIKKRLTSQHLNYITSIGIEKLENIPDPKKNDLWIDAIFGNNQKGSVDNQIIDLFNEKFKGNFGKIVSIDLPTGLNPNTGKTFTGGSIKANFTLSIGIKRVGILQDTAMPYVGKIHNIDIGFTIEQLKILTNRFLSISRDDIEALKLSLPPNNVSKYKRGRTLLIAGSEKYLGAINLVIKGALASGAGFIKALVPQTVVKSIWQVAPEIVVEGSLEHSSEGNALIYNSLKEIDLNKFESVVIGPGIGLDIKDWENSIKYLLNYKGVLILDADALNRIAKSNLGCKFFLERQFETWITPHLGEFQRLFPELTGLNNIELAVDAAQKFGISILFKGAHSIIADRDGKAWQIYETDSDSARAGLGDLLSGFISGMVALEIASGEHITTESFAKYVFMHSYATLNCINGSTSSIIAKELSRVVREKKMGQMS